MVAEQDRQRVATGYGKKPYLLTEKKTICTPLKNVFLRLLTKENNQL